MTLAYLEILLRVAETSGIPRDVLGVADASLCRTFIGAHLRRAWNNAPWPELRHVSSFAVSSRLVSRTVSATESIGQVRKVTTGNPRAGTGWHKYPFWERGTYIELGVDVDTCWIDYIEACPDLPATGDTDLDTFPVPLRLVHPVTLMAAGSFAKAKGREAEGNVLLGLGEAELARETHYCLTTAEP